MFRKILWSKIHKVHVTHADLEYEGSITIPEDILELSLIKEYEAVEIWNVTNGNRLSTYAIKGLRESSIFCVNGAAAHLCKPGDIIIIASFVFFREDQIQGHQPRVLFMESNNTVKSIRSEVAGPSF